MMITLGKLITLFGLFFDVLGAWYISRGIIKKTEDELKSETGFAFAPNDNYIISGLKQKIEGDYGFAFLTLGFTFQGISTIFNSGIFLNQVSLLYLLATSIIVLTIIILVEGSVRRAQKRSVGIHVYKVIQRHLNSSGDKPMHILDIKRFLGYLEVEVEDNYTQDQAWVKLKEQLRLSKEE